MSSASNRLDCTIWTFVQLSLCSRVLDNHMSNCPVGMFFTLWIPPRWSAFDASKGLCEPEAFDGQAGVRPFSGAGESGA